MLYQFNVCYEARKVEGKHLVALCRADINPQSSPIYKYDIYVCYLIFYWPMLLCHKGSFGRGIAIYYCLH